MAAGPPAPIVKGMTTDVTDLDLDLDLRIRDDGGAVTVVAVDPVGAVVGRAAARRAGTGGGGAADLSLWTDPSARRRGVARRMLASVAAWARAADVTYLVGDVPGDEPAATPFLAGCGMVVARRSGGGPDRFALLVPRAEPPVARESFADAVAALEAGASLAEAEAVYDHLTAA